MMVSKPQYVVISCISAAAIAWRLLAFPRRKNSTAQASGCYDGTRDSADIEKSDEPNASPHPDMFQLVEAFPWEPGRPAERNQEVSRPQDFDPTLSSFACENSGRPSQPQRNKNITLQAMTQEDRLAFIASMTFASSTLREPSCLCCK